MRMSPKGLLYVLVIAPTFVHTACEVGITEENALGTHLSRIVFSL